VPGKVKGKPRVPQGRHFDSRLCAGLIFAWATGTNAIFFRLPRRLHKQAIEDGGRFDPTYGNDFIEFPAWSSWAEGDSPLIKALEKWTQVAFDESLKLEVES
jgi:hypothetical protein